MEPQIIAFDWSRLFLGEAPPLFLAEILLRIAIIWPWTMLLLRWVGGRSISQLSLVEFLLVISLGSAVGDTLFYPQVPLVHAMLVIFVVVVIDKLVDWLICRFQRAKKYIDGQPIEAIRDGVICMDAVAKTQIGAQELKERLRLKGIDNLGMVARAYLEPSGQLSVFLAKPVQKGLPIVPPVELLPTRDKTHAEGCCINCGSYGESLDPCRLCKATGRVPPKLSGMGEGM